MLKLIIPESEDFDEAKSEFIIRPETTLRLEHSLVSLSKWESIWEKPFLTETEKTTEETISYIKAMTLTEDVDDAVYNRLTSRTLDAIRQYIDAPMTATTFSELPNRKPPSRQIVTSELIYFWMITYTIPFECQYWHLNRLTTLIKICDHKNQPNKKMSKADLSARYREMNEKRKAQFGTKG